MNKTAYDVHSYMDNEFAGTSDGCTGYVQNKWGGTGADEGLDLAIAWAKKYNKKFMVTEMGSYPDAALSQDGTNQHCEAKMAEYIKRMDESGVFIGRQVWQFGCPQCDADQWTHRPYNLGWYQIKRCSEDSENCMHTACCYDPGRKCYKKDDHWASCLPAGSCKAGEVNPSDPPEFKTLWNCTDIATLCSADHEDCRETRCCKDPSSQCYVKDEHWASCRSSCMPGVDPDELQKYQTPWNCSKLMIGSAR